ncbi:MAG TPA: DoxX family protein [Terriglobales bacterium]|nr:DoxX family protein [Terriglobales bacterium]
MHKGFDSRLDQAWWALRIGLGVGPFLAGLDKYFHLLANWPAYMSPLALKILPFSAQTFMHIVGVIEMIVGLAILTKWTRLGSYVASVWLLAIAINLVSTGMFFDVAVRDVEIALAAFVLARLTESRRSTLSSDTLQEQRANIVAAA